jgi:putative DNA primase/helicase
MNIIDIGDYKRLLTMSDVLRIFGFPSNKTLVNCPFHEDKEPSFRVDEYHGYCFSCQTHVDTLDFISFQLTGQRKASGESLFKAINWICDQTGTPRPSHDPQFKERANRLQNIREAYSAVWADALVNSRPGVAYLGSRGISETTAEKNCGYLAPNYKPRDWEQAKAAGLVSQHDNLLFAGRCIIPIFHHGEIVNFYGRAIRKDQKPNHIYCAGTDPRMPETLWGLNNVNGDSVTICESIIDGLTLRDRGLLNTTSVFGASGMTPARIKALKDRGVSSVQLIFDTDPNTAGQTGVLKTGAALLRQGIAVTVRELPPGPNNSKMDLNLYFQLHGIEEFNKIEAIPILDKLLEPAKAAGDPETRLRALQPVIEIIADRPDTTWSEYAKIVKKHIPDLDLRNIQKQIRAVHKYKSDDKSRDEKTFKPLVWAQKICETSRFLFSQGEFYRYETGYYQRMEAEQISRIIIDAVASDDIRSFEVEDIRRFIQVEAFQTHEMVNPSHLINLENCVLDTSGAEPVFKKQTSDVFLTYKVPVEFDESASCSLWLQTVQEILPDQQLQLLLSQIFGYSLTTDISFQTGFYQYGTGSNGKSLVMGVLQRLLGVKNYSSLGLSDFRERFRLAELEGKLVNFTSEQGRDEILDDGTIKSVITGDPILAERKYQQPFNLQSHAKLIVSSNNLPRTADSSLGFLRRWKFIPFVTVFNGHNTDLNRLDRIVDTELPGVLNWSLGGLKVLKRNKGFIETAAMKELKDSFKRRTNPILNFVEESLQVTPGNDLLRGDPKKLYKEYREWAEEAGVKPFGRNHFYEKLEQATGVKRIKSREKHYFPGIISNKT